MFLIKFLISESWLESSSTTNSLSCWRTYSELISSWMDSLSDMSSSLQNHTEELTYFFIKFGKLNNFISLLGFLLAILTKVRSWCLVVFHREKSAAYHGSHLCYSCPSSLQKMQSSHLMHNSCQGILWLSLCKTLTLFLPSR